jgi:hypothetical protein
MPSVLEGLDKWLKERNQRPGPRTDDDSETHFGLQIERVECRVQQYAGRVYICFGSHHVPTTNQQLDDLPK